MQFRETRRAAVLAAVLAAVALAMTALAAAADTANRTARQAAESAAPSFAVAIPTTGQSTAPAVPMPTPEATQTKTDPAPRYELTDAERDDVERVVMAEAGGEPYDGQMLVAQCILNAAEKTGKRPPEAVIEFQYASARPDPTQSVKDAVAAVFDRGATVVDDVVLWFYNPAKVKSAWHETQHFVIEIGGHRFFSEKGVTE